MNDNVHKMPPVPPFVKFVAAAVPMVFDDSLSYYEALCALWKYISGMTDVINNNATLEEEYIEKFNELKEFVDHYFDNLDVQEEINNKLDEMADDGELADIISQYLNSTAIFGYDTVNNMKSADNLVNGSYARTLGYYSVGDGGGALYQVKDSVTESDIFVTLDSGVYAVLKSDDISANQFGCKGDGVTDDTDKLQDYIDYCIANSLNIILNAGATYLVTSVLINAKANVFGNGAVIKANSSADLFNINITSANNKVLIKNVVIDANNIAESALHIIEGRNVEFCESEIRNCPTYGIDFVAGYELYVHNVNIYNTSVHQDSIAINALSGDSKFDDIVIKQFKTGIYNSSSTNYFCGIHGWNTFSEIVKGSTFFTLNAGCFIENCYCDTYQYGYKVIRSSRNVVLRNCRNYTNPDFISLSVLDNEKAYIFFFDNDDADLSAMIDNEGMVTTTGSFDGELRYSNISKDAWLNCENSIAKNPDTASVLGSGYMPIGTFFTLTDVDTTKWTVNRQNIVVSDNMVHIDLIAQFIGTTGTSTGQTIGNLPLKCRFEKNKESYGALLTTRYQAPTGLVSAYFNATSGAIEIHFPDGATATNKYVELDVNHPLSFRS